MLFNNKGTDKNENSTNSTITDKTKNEDKKNETEQLNNPQTGDNILTYLTAFLASFIGIAFSIFKKKK